MDPPPVAPVRGWTGFTRVIATATTCWFRSGVGELASAVAFQTQLSLAPFVLLLMSGASRLLGSAAAREALLGVVRSFAGEDVVSSARSVIDEIVSARGGALVTIVGIATMAYFSSGVLLQLRSAMHRIWGTRSTLRGALLERVISLVLVPAAIVALLVTMFVGFAAGIAAPLVSGWFPRAGQVWAGLVSLFTLALLTLQLAFVFRFGTTVKLRWRDVWPGAALTAALFTLGNALIGRVVGRSLLVPLYGPAGALLVVLLWAYYGVQILLFGACFTRAWTERFGSRSTALVVH